MATVPNTSSDHCSVSSGMALYGNAGSSVKRIGWHLRCM
uniref:Uncharacterized protein n=1 Tax=Arundo donax TaxID=35708 RepID=A0A0A8Y7T4_ARUDO